MRKSLSPRRKRILSLARRDGWRCHYCNAVLSLAEEDEEEQYPTIDHFVPKHLGGPNAKWNLVLSCRPCNLDKGHTHGHDYLRLKEQQVA
jgi:5-methylcytosine-specific restriction endonuclease McrA